MPLDEAPHARARLAAPRTVAYNGRRRIERFTHIAGRCTVTNKGDTWNECESSRDTFTQRRVLRITTAGCYNQTPTYHTGTAWTADGKTLCFHSGRNGASALFRCDLPSGDITQLTEWAPGMAVGRVAGAAAAYADESIHGGICVAPRKRWVTFIRGRSLCAVHLDTLEERTLIDDWGYMPIGMPTIDAEERTIAYPRNIVPEPMRGADRLTVHVAVHYAAPGGSLMQLCRIPLEGGEEEVLYEEAMCRGNHLQYSPTDPDLLMTDRDYPSRFWFGSDGRTNRVWLYRISTREMIEMPSPSGKTFQVHSTWTWDGQYGLYHCPGPDGYHIGLDDLAGNTVREWNSPGWKYYGHVSAMQGRPAFILDGNLTDDLLLWFYHDADQPRIEVIARHGTNWGGHEGQYPHPHPQSSPTGQHICYNHADRGRSDVFVVEV